MIEILTFLDDNNLTENTIIIFTADHGDMFFEHNRRNKGVPYEASARIPFVIRYPAKIKAGKVINTAYNNIDFTPNQHVLDSSDSIFIARDLPRRIYHCIPRL